METEKTYKHIALWGTQLAEKLRAWNTTSRPRAVGAGAAETAVAAAKARREIFILNFEL